jgi:peptidyl-prolyl cis-trans isomerase B (cyclophilin B)
MNMSKFHIGLFIIIIAVFFGIVVITEEGSQSNKSTTAPTLPPAAATFQMITPTGVSNINKLQAQQQQQQQAQQQQAQQQQTQNSQAQVGTVEGPIAASVSATIKTARGNINVTLFGDKAPITVKNFIAKAESNFYKGLIFHRVEDWVIQGGDPTGTGTGGGEMPTEINDQPFVIGSLGMARGSNPQISNDSQFFITKTDASWLNGQYTNFGIVTSGMSVVDKIQIGDKIEGITINQ